MDNKIYDVVILGGGPAGLAAGLYAGRSRLSVLILEKGIDGGQIAVTHDIENYPGQSKVDGMTGQELVAPMTEQCKKFGCERVSDTITACDFSGPVKKFVGSKGEYLGKTVIVCTGSQGEPMSALHRMAFSEHKQVTIDAGDRIIISASAIPGNEITISRVIDELFQKGAEVIYDRNTPLHVSGHACQEELKMMLALTKPRYFIPVHGEYRMLCKHAEIGKLMGVEPKNVLVAKNGEVIEITKRSMRATSNVPAGDVYIDGTGIGDVGSAVLRDRRHLAEDGIVMAIITLSSENGKPVADPEIITRGFIYVKESEELMNELKTVVMSAAEGVLGRRSRDIGELKGAIKSGVSNYLFKTTKRSPMVIPVITKL